MRGFIAFPVLLAGLIAPALTLAAERTIIVLDGSGSMWGQIESKPKIEIARETLKTVLGSVSADTELGLIAYGHRQKGECSDIELAVPPRAGSASDIMSFAEGINPKGKTPLSDAVRIAADALKYTEEKATVVLVTDGLETCEADPCALASELEQNGVDFTAHVVGFGLTEEEGQQVACLAENTGGKYLQASDAGQLASALEETVAVAEPSEPKPAPEPAKPEFNVATDAFMYEGGPSLGDTTQIRWDLFKADANGEPDGKMVEGGYGAAQNFNLEPGHYVGIARWGRLEKLVVFDATAEAQAKPSVNFDAGLVTVVPKRTPDDAEPDSQARIDAAFAGLEDGGYGETTLVVAAGEVTISGRIGKVTAEKTLTIKPGETVTEDLVIGTGLVVTKAVYAEGGPAVEGGEIRFDVMEAKKNINGDRENFAGGYGVDDQLDVPTGELVLAARLGSATGETTFRIEAGERKEVTVNINAGVLAISAPGAYRVDIRETKKDIQGRQKDVSGGYDETYQDTVPPGDYIVHVTYEGDKAPVDKPATVKAGERTDVTVE